MKKVMVALNTTSHLSKILMNKWTIIKTIFLANDVSRNSKQIKANRLAEKGRDREGIIIVV